MGPSSNEQYRLGMMNLQSFDFSTAGQGHARACYAAALCCENGWGTRCDEEDYKRWVRLGVSRLDPGCVSEAHLEGIDVPVDIERSVEIGEKAAEEGDSLLQGSTGFLLLHDEKRWERGFDWIVKGAGEGRAAMWVHSLQTLQIVAPPVLVLAYLKRNKATYADHPVLGFMAYTLAYQMECLKTRAGLAKKKE
jgi:TPR repeat protein